MVRTMNNRKLAFLFPGQGAQYPGMAKDFYDAFSEAREVFEEADEILGLRFSDLIFNGPADELTLTKNSQLGIYIASAAILRTVQKQFPDLQPAVCAGLSLGEYTALLAAGKITFADGIKLVQARAQYMNDACIAHPGTMQVVLGLTPEAVEEAIQHINPPHQVWIANLNCPGQVVIAGTQSGIQAAAELLKSKGAKRVLPLDVSGAFHSGLMQEAQERLEPKIRETHFSDSSIEIVMNAVGGYVSDLESIRNHLILQVTNPVRWEQGIRAMASSGIELFIEMGCGKTLQGMNKRIGIDQPTFSVEKISDLETLSQIPHGVVSCNS